MDREIPIQDASVGGDVERAATSYPRRATPVPRAGLFAPLAPPAKGTTRVIVASGLRLLCDGLSDALGRSPSMHILASATSAERTRAVICEFEPDVVLLDIDMAESLALVNALRDVVPSPKIVALAASDADDALVGYIEAGIAGYVTRDGSIEDVVATVESVVRGETIVSPRLAASLFKRLAARRRREDRAPAGDPPALTTREHQILSLIEQGMANKEIARALGIELATVKNHVHRLLEKLQVSRRGQAAARAREARRRKTD